MLQTGSEVLHQQKYVSLEGRRVGLLTNPSAVDAEMITTYQHFVNAETVNLVALFGAEHGAFGGVQAGEHVGGMVDSATHIPIYSLYGQQYRPSGSMLSDVDVMVCDIQDIGIRYYTYLWTMTHIVEACGEHGVAVIILDRANPLGDNIRGRGLDEGFSSLVGRYDVPMQHGMTIGEMLQMHNALWNPTPADLQVIPCNGYERGQVWVDFDRPFVPPSPNIPHMSTVLHYVGACLVEGTTLSEGRGTTLPFEIVGAPYLDGILLAGLLNEAGLNGVLFRPHQFTPTMSKFAGEVCDGMQVHISDNSFDALHTWLTVIYTIKHQYPDQFGWIPPFTDGDHPFIDKLSGSADLRQQLDDGATVDMIMASWHQNEAKFRQQREPFLIYTNHASS